MAKTYRLLANCRSWELNVRAGLQLSYHCFSEQYHMLNEEKEKTEKVFVLVNAPVRYLRAVWILIVCSSLSGVRHILIKIHTSIIYFLWQNMWEMMLLGQRNKISFRSDYLFMRIIPSMTLHCSDSVFQFKSLYDGIPLRRVVFYLIILQ